MASHARVLPWVLVFGAGLAALTPRPARACGCLSPPEVIEGDYGVNQQAEQIIFEVGEGTVTAHVLIRYAGEPESFAWIVPVPNQPALALSESAAFPLLAAATDPTPEPREVSACPSALYSCAYHPDCYGGTGGGGDTGGVFVAPADGGAGPDAPPDGVDVLDMQVIGSYETVTFAASDADLAVQWLQDNGFVVNDTTTPYMQPYIDAGMVFVAAKLVAGAGLDEIRPLKMTYQGDKPMIPLQLTAVAAEPHLTVTAYIYGEDYYRPVDHPMLDLSGAELSHDAAGRGNYPMFLARAIDDAGGDAFALEHSGLSPYPNAHNDPSGCCITPDSDLCNVANDGACQCPGSTFDAPDCDDLPGVNDGGALLYELAANHLKMTRLTTRVSPEEMDFDPMFEPDPNGVGLQPEMVDERYTFQGEGFDCRSDILDQAAADAVAAIEGCAAVYCGAGTCVATADGAGCACDAGFVARAFTDLDGEPSVTCVPATPPVDLQVGTSLPDACAGVSCGDGLCVDLNGFPACACSGATAGVLDAQAPAGLSCRPITALTSSPGAERFSEARLDVEACAPAPPTCGPDGWLVPNPGPVSRPGVMCASSMPNPADTVPPPPPECNDTNGWVTGGSSGSSGGSGSAGASEGDLVLRQGCACRPSPAPAPLHGAGVLALLAGLRRRRRGR